MALVTGSKFVACYNKNEVRGTGHGNGAYCDVGGISGDRGEIIYSYNTGAIYSSYAQVGGIQGDAYATNDIVHHCYNIGQLTGSERVGAIRGNNYDQYNRPSQISYCWYTTNTPVVGIGRGVSNCSKVSEEELKGMVETLGSEYFTEDKANINGGYPILRWEQQKMN